MTVKLEDFVGVIEDSFRAVAPPNPPADLDARNVVAPDYAGMASKIHIGTLTLSLTLSHSLTHLLVRRWS